MGKIAYVNSAYIRQNQASVSIEDRGFQFADAVYEVWSVFDGELADRDGHLDRLERSFSECPYRCPCHGLPCFAYCMKSLGAIRLKRALFIFRSVAAKPPAIMSIRKT